MYDQLLLLLPIESGQNLGRAGMDLAGASEEGVPNSADVVAGMAGQAWPGRQGT